MKHILSFSLTTRAIVHNNINVLTYCNIGVQIAFLEEFDHAYAMQFWPGSRFSKVPKTLRARKVMRKTPTRLICEAGLLTCCKGKKN